MCTHITIHLAAYVPGTDECLNSEGTLPSGFPNFLPGSSKEFLLCSPQLVRQRLLKADIEAFLKPVLAEGTASSRLCLLTANVSQWRAVLDSDQLEESQVVKGLLVSFLCCP